VLTIRLTQRTASSATKGPSPVGHGCLVRPEYSWHCQHHRTNVSTRSGQKDLPDLSSQSGTVDSVRLAANARIISSEMNRPRTNRSG